MEAGGWFLADPRPVRSACRRPIVVIALALVLTIALAVDAAASSASGDRAGLGPGCDRSRPAVAHYEGAVRLRPQPRDRPIPCMTLVGQSVESATIGVTRSGTVVYAPLDPNDATPPQNVVQGPEYAAGSDDDGATWTALGSGGPTTGSLVPPWMDVDPVTSRIWFVTTLPSLCGARISWSDDDGRHWATNPSVGCPGQGSERVLEGPPPRGGARPHGYPHVVYYCGNGTDIEPSVLYCYKSLDGGRTFTSVGGFPDPGPPGYCGVEHAARPGIVGPNGFLYFPLDLCGQLGVAISRDEGATWQRLPIATTDIQDLYITSAAADSAGNVYIAWVAGSGAAAGVGGAGLPYLVLSKNDGQTWSRPMMIAAPGVQQVRHVAITATGVGRIALAYLGASTTDAGAPFSGYITESSNALSRRPVFMSAAVNDPARPLIAQPFITGPAQEPFGNRLFLIADAFAPDRTAWAAFHCAYESACPDARVGVAARLVPR